MHRTGQGYPIKKKYKKNNTQFTEISLYGHTHRQDKINRITGSDITIYQWKSRKKPPAGEGKKRKITF
jgi:hypothetical protein